MAALTRPRFRCAFEPGCSIGLLTELLADRCDRLLATDISATAVKSARRRVGDRVNVSVQELAVPQRWPTGRAFDLIVLSEIGYHCSRSDLGRLIERAVGSLTPDGIIVACHWRHPAPDHPLTGDQVHDVLTQQSGLRVIAAHLEADFRLDVLAASDAPSVARWDGVLR